MTASVWRNRDFRLVAAGAFVNRVFFALFALSGLPNTMSQIGAAGAAQRLCPPELLGRFQGLLSAAGSVGAIGGSLLIGAALTGGNVRLLLNVQAGLYTACGVATLLLVIRRVPKGGELDDSTPSVA